MKAAVKELLKEFHKSYTKYDSVNRWKNKLSGGEYQNYCLESLALFCVKFNMTPDQVIQTRIEEQKSSDPLTRAKAEDRLLGFHKEMVTKSPGLAICRFRHMKSFYSANYVALQCTDPGYTIQREQDYLPTRTEIHDMCELVSLEVKAYLLVLAESCGRPGAVAELTWADIRGELNSEIVPCQIWLQHKVKLSRKKYFSFICGDAKKTLQLLLNRKKQLLPTAKVFAATVHTLRRKIMEAAAEIGIANLKGGLQAFRLHCLRKRGQTLLERAHVPLNWVDRILGHVPRGAQGKTYSLPDVEAMRAEYTKSMSQLTVYNVATSMIQSDITQQQTLRQIIREELQKMLASASPEQIVKIQMLEKKLHACARLRA